MKTYLNRTITNSIGKEAVQSVAIEKEENNNIWCVVRHDNVSSLGLVPSCEKHNF